MVFLLKVIIPMSNEKYSEWLTENTGGNSSILLSCQTVRTQGHSSAGCFVSPSILMKEQTTWWWLFGMHHPSNAAVLMRKVRRETWGVLYLPKLVIFIYFSLSASIFLPHSGSKETIKTWMFIVQLLNARSQLWKLSCLVNNVDVFLIYSSEFLVSIKPVFL